MQQNKIMVTYFDWMTSMASELPIKPDLIVASDVVYDSEVVLSLARTIANLIEPNERTNTRCLIAGTVRNEDTLRTFISALETNGLKLDESFTFSDGTFTFEDGRCIIEPSLFPFVATLQCPTTFHWISSA
ncbi:unnamed protein product [Toxocara canis]|nr:unnamed protein product [Toxocara canis]